MIALIDADSLFYKATYKVEKSSLIEDCGIDPNDEEALNQLLVDASLGNCEIMLDDIFTDIMNDGNNIIITGIEYYVTKCTNSLRKQLDAYYKSNRKPNALVGMLRDMYILKNDAHYDDNFEADDLIADRARELGIGNYVIVTMDKDLYQIGGFLYNYYKKPTKYDENGVPIETFSRRGLSYINEFEAMKVLARQMIAGDSGDRIKGLPRRGEVAAKKAIDPCTNEFGLMRAVIKSYMEVYGDDYSEQLLLNYRLLYLGTSL